VALEPENAAAHYNLGRVYQEFGRDREALAEWERALQLRPDYPAAQAAIAELQRHGDAPAVAASSPGITAPPLSAPLADPALDALRASPLLLADEIIRRERAKTPRGMVAILVVLALGLIGLLAEPYLPIGMSFAVFILVMTVVLPLIGWCVFWLQIQSLRRKEEEALRRGDKFDAAVARADRKMYEWMQRWDW
jgi:tetratricopeptide (TPR) repeat protein